MHANRGGCEMYRNQSGAPSTHPTSLSLSLPLSVHLSLSLSLYLSFSLSCFIFLSPSVPLSLPLPLSLSPSLSPSRCPAAVAVLQFLSSNTLIRSEASIPPAGFSNRRQGSGHTS